MNAEPQNNLPATLDHLPPDWRKDVVVAPYPTTEQTRSGQRIVTRWAILRPDGSVACTTRTEADAVDTADVMRARGAVYTHDGRVG